MIQTYRESSLARLLMLLALVSFWACSSQEESETAGEGDGSESMVEVVEQPAAGSGQQESTDGQRKEAYVDAYLNRADRLHEAGQLEEAKQQVLMALNVDDKNERAQAKLAQLNELLGRSSAPQDLAQQVIDHRKAMRARQIAEVNDRYLRASQAYNRGEYADAERELKIAQDFINFDAYQTEWGSLRNDVANLSSEVARTIEAESTRKEAATYEAAYQKLREEESRERAQRERNIKAMMDESFDAFLRQDFEHSEAVAQQALSMAPSLRQAKDMVEMSRQARHAAWRQAYYKKRREQIQIWKEQMRDLQIPWQDTIRFPSRSQWDDITRMRRARGAVDSPDDDSEVVSALRGKLENERVTWEFPDTPLKEVIEHIRDTQGVNILMSRTALDEKGEESVNFKVNNLQFGDALKTMLSSYGLTYNFRFNSIYVVGQNEASGNVVPRVYEVRDLTIKLPNFVPPRLHLRPGPAGEASSNAVFGSEKDPVAETEPEQLLDLVKENVAPSTWEIEGRHADLSAGQLVVLTTPEVHAQIAAFLEELRNFTKVIVHVETRFIAMREGFLSEIGVDIRGGGGATPGSVALLDDVSNGNVTNASAGLDNGGAGNIAQSPAAGAFFRKGNDLDFRARNENIFNRVLGGFLSPTGGATIGFQFLDDVELNVLLSAVEKSAFANVLTAPRLTIYNNQRANLTLVNQVSYVKDYDVEVAQTAFIADPLVDIVQDGLVLDVRPTVSHDRKYVTLEVQPTVAILGRPIPTFSTPLAGLTTNVIIELPEIEYRSAQTTVTVPDNGWVVIGGLRSVTTVDRRSEVPVLGQIPILSYFFSKKGRSDELSDLMIVLHVQIIDLDEEESKLTAR